MIGFEVEFAFFLFCFLLGCSGGFNVGNRNVVYRGKLDYICLLFWEGFFVFFLFVSYVDV